MDKQKKKLIIGILGGIGSGKSTVAAEFAKFGCKVIDADRLAHELLAESGVKEKIIELFGRGILDSSEKINRAKLACFAFGDADKLASLNKILHPLVLIRVERLLEDYEVLPQVKAIVLDMPLLAEVGWAKRCDKLIFIDCDRKLRLQRAKKLGIDENQLKIRENFQISLDSKLRIADSIIHNNSDFPMLVRRVNDIFTCIMNSE